MRMLFPVQCLQVTFLCAVCCVRTAASHRHIPTVFREQVQQEVQHLQAGVDSLFHAMKKPAQQVRPLEADT
jgi:hypothetical protein